VRSFIRAGNDLTYVAIPKLTKRSLAVERTVKQMTPERLKHGLEMRGKAFVDAVQVASKGDKTVAIAAIESMMSACARQLTVIGVSRLHDGATQFDASALRRLASDMESRAQAA
jgi:hypothetical protein